MKEFKLQLLSNSSYIGYENTNINFPTNDYILKDIINNYNGKCISIELENCSFHDDILNILLKKLICNHTKKIVLKNCNTIDTKFLCNLILNSDLILDELNLINTNHSNDLICNLIKLNKVKYIKIGSKSSGLALYSEQLKKFKIPTLINKLDRLINSHLESDVIINTSHLLPNEILHYGAFTPKNDKEYQIKTEALQKIDIIKEINNNNKKKHILKDIKIKI